MDVSDRISFAPLVALAREMSRREQIQDVPALLATLEAADRELARETASLRNQLHNAESRAVAAETRHTNLVRELEATAKEISALKELVGAREAAHRAQDKLVAQLKHDNATLRQSYAAAVGRMEEPYVRTERRISVTVGGNRRDMQFSDKELADMFVENERLERVGKELVRQVETQKVAHRKLRDTVSELMTQLEQGGKERERREGEVKNLEVIVGRLEKNCAEKDERVDELQRKLNKLQAEYEAVNAANTYNNAEVVKLKMKLGAKRNEGRQRNAGGVLGGVENLLHRRGGK